MKTRWTVAVGLALISGALSPSATHAQQPGVREPVLHSQVISGNPLILLAEWFNAEYERKVAETVTVGVAGGWLSLDGGEDDYVSVNGFVRYYPQAAALTGFFLGWKGYPGKGRALGVQDVKFTGQILPTSKRVTYHLEIKRVLALKLTMIIADGSVSVDGRKIYSAKTLKVGLFSSTDAF